MSTSLQLITPQNITDLAQFTDSQEKAKSLMQDYLLVIANSKDKSALEKCTTESHIQAIKTLTNEYHINSIRSDEVSLIPYTDKVKVDLMVKGIAREISLASGGRAVLHAEVVYQNDEFELDKEPMSYRHKTQPFNKGNMIGAYATIHIDGQLIAIEAMDQSQIESVRDSYSKQKNGMGWTKSADQMWKKTVARRVANSIKVRSELAKFELTDNTVLDKSNTDVEYSDNEYIDAEHTTVDTEPDSQILDELNSVINDYIAITKKPRVQVKGAIAGKFGFDIDSGQPSDKIQEIINTINSYIEEAIREASSQDAAKSESSNDAIFDQKPQFTQP